MLSENEIILIDDVLEETVTNKFMRKMPLLIYLRKLNELGLFDDEKVSLFLQKYYQEKEG